MKTYVYIDAENHFLRFTAAAAKVIGSQKAPQALLNSDLLISGIRYYPKMHEGKRFWWNWELQLFWDCETLGVGGVLGPMADTIARAIYVCSVTGDADKAYATRVALRKYGFDPIVIDESKPLRKQRETLRKKDGLIDKPKGCDIALVTRMVADAAANLYDNCLLFTSDADFIPAIQAVRGMGKVVWVFGVESCLGNNSPYLHVPDRFVDLEQSLRPTWQNYRKKIEDSLVSLGEAGPFTPSDS